MYDQVEFAKATGHGCGPGDMSLLDWFAGQVLAEGYSAERSYAVALEMMAERKKVLAAIRTRLAEGTR
jgi:hypothetical protein